MKVYIAAPYPCIVQARGVRRALALHGISTTSGWLDSDAENSDTEARLDLEHVAMAGAFVALNPEGWSDKGTGGRHVELGFAIALSKRIILVGARTNLFHHLDSITVVGNIEALIKELT